MGRSGALCTLWLAATLSACADDVQATPGTESDGDSGDESPDVSTSDDATGSEGGDGDGDGDGVDDGDSDGDGDTGLPPSEPVEASVVLYSVRTPLSIRQLWGREYGPEGLGDAYLLFESEPGETYAFGHQSDDESGVLLKQVHADLSVSFMWLDTSVFPPPEPTLIEFPDAEVAQNPTPLPDGRLLFAARDDDYVTTYFSWAPDGRSSPSLRASPSTRPSTATHSMRT